ncbi:MAG: sulfur oxidation c-type cytochrome SoxA [Magnetococcales bacterium]|nr:sulfur oxidation c-type cytochrome SoxA [Magnetococcales bacterium]
MKTRRSNVLLQGVLGLAALAFVASPAMALDLKGYDANKDPGLYKYSENFRGMAEFPPSDGMLEDGKALFNKDRSGQSCATCHGEDGEKLVGASTHYPKYDEKLGKPKLIQHQINSCLTERMGQEALKWEKGEQVMLTTYVKALSNGMPLSIQTDGPMAKFIELGKKAYDERIGHFDIACKHCHNTAAGTNIRAEYMSAPDNTGYANLEAVVAKLPANPERERRLAAGAAIGSGSVDHWPIYRTKWGKLATMQRRLRTCNKNVRAVVHDYGSDYYVNLEAYLGSISNGMEMNVPGFRP